MVRNKLVSVVGVNPPADIASGRAHIVRWTMVLRRPKRSVDLKVNALISTSVMYRLLVSNFVSFFAPFLLILQLNQDKIGCKSEAKRNKKEEAEYESGRY
ncbi:hypothetical protein DXC93_14730 [Dorea formicigenerans]|uniref:Uncharacterized protein n=1 Tax=Dorea formicigenerans TaxID=39486 RepID=A0A3E4PIR3_9FIRM|nr:hypothetical protein DXC93_14730 [Dorea formicigenerans]